MKRWLNRYRDVIAFYDSIPRGAQKILENAPNRAYRDTFTGRLYDMYQKFREDNKAKIEAITNIPEDQKNQQVLMTFFNLNDVKKAMMQIEQILTKIRNDQEEAIAKAQTETVGSD